MPISEVAGAKMRRRTVIQLLCGAAAWPLAASAQQSAMPVIGFVNSGSPQDHAQHLAAFLKGLSETGHDEGRNVVIEYRWADHQNERLPAMVDDLVRRQVAVIAATTTPAALAAKTAATTIPIVFEIGGNPAQWRGRNNITGVSQSNTVITPRRLELLHELVPKARVIALLVNPTNPAGMDTTHLQTMARARGLQLHILEASTERDLGAVFESLIKISASGLVIAPDPFFVAWQEQLAALAVRHAVPTIFQNREFVAAGGLISFGASVSSAYHATGVYVGRILKGEKPRNLPILQGTKAELYINLKSAKALGLTVPKTLILHADEIIE
jgi:putative tryptophan/tyrosine transport system substrate-binding protein